MLWVKQTFLSVGKDREDRLMGKEPWYNTSTNDLGELYRMLRKECGPPRNMYCDGLKVGWVSTRRIWWEGTGVSFICKVLTWVSSTKPSTKDTEENVTNPWGKNT